MAERADDVAISELGVTGYPRGPVDHVDERDAPTRAELAESPARSHRADRDDGCVVGSLREQCGDAFGTSDHGYASDTRPPREGPVIDDCHRLLPGCLGEDVENLRGGLSASQQQYPENP